MKNGNYGSASDAAALHENSGLIELGLDENIELWAVIDGKTNSILDVSTGFDSREAIGVYDGVFRAPKTFTLQTSNYLGNGRWYTGPVDYAR